MNSVADGGRLTIVLVGPASSVHIRRWVTTLSDAGTEWWWLVWRLVHVFPVSICASRPG